MQMLSHHSESVIESFFNPEFLSFCLIKQEV